MRRLVPAILLAIWGCSSSPVPAPVALTCEAGTEAFRGRCVDPWARYEPDERIDQDNVSAYGDALTVLELPEPPKSGFRLIAPPRPMKAGQEIDTCISWPIPDVARNVIYSARLYTTPGLHHSNVVAKPIDLDLGENPYPACNPGAGDPFSQIGQGIPDVLFANSTQVVGEETLTFPVGMGYPIDVTREVSTDFHLLNAGGDAEVVEVAYDFFTMDPADLQMEVAPFMMQVNDFLIPPHTTKTIGSTCNVFGGNVITMMPHTHKLAQAFTVDLIPDQGAEQRVLDDGAFDPESDIHHFDPPLDLTGIAKARFECTFDNTTDHDVVYGIGENEMCILFGYVYPAIKQFVAYSDYQGDPCNSIQIGLFR